MDREALVTRNLAMAEAFHALPLKHRIRRALLHSLAKVPISKGKTATQHKILLIRPDHIGDLLLTTPAMVALRSALPNAEIHALVGSWSATAIASLDAVDNVITLPFPGFNRGDKGSLQSPYQLALQTAQQLRQIGYTSAVIMRPDHWWGAMVAHLAGIPERIGYAHDDVAPFLTHKVDLQHQHAVLQNLRLMERWTGAISPEDALYQFSIDPADHQYINEYLAKRDIAPQQTLICIHPGSGTWAKRWDEANWADVADTLATQLNAKIVFTGGGSEILLVKSIAEQMQAQRPLIVAGETQIGQLAALYARSRVILGPDSGPMHLAAAVGTPTVTLFGPADPVEFAPWGDPDKHVVLTTAIGCRPCRVLDWGMDNPEFHPCVREISVGRVLEAARRVIN